MPGSRTPVESLGELGDRTIRKVKRRVLPLIVFLYFIAFLDRNNVGFAKLTMSKDLGLSATAFGLGAGIFFVGYAIFEIPSNAGMLKFGARKWIARILLSWGFFATIMALVTNELTFYIIRFLLGAAEAGFFPAIILYLTLWFPARQRVAVLGIFILAQPIANAIGAPISGLLLKMDGILGLAGWQWMYIIEGVPAMLMAFVALKAMTDYPKDAMWLTLEERTWLQNKMDGEDAAKGTGHKHSFMAGLKDPRSLIFAALYFGLVMGIYGLSLWLPSIVKAMGDLSNTQVGFIVPIPYVCAAVFVAAMGIFAAISPFWELPAAALAGAAAASGIALINSLGNLGGFASPYAVGVLVDKTGDSKYGLLMLAAVLFITAIATFLYGRKIHAGKVPPLSHEDLLAKETAAFDLPAGERHHRGDPSGEPVTPRETRP